MCEDGAQSRPDPRRTLRCWLFGIGASAGGIKALREFFAQLKRANGSIAGDVVILHFSPDTTASLWEKSCKWWSPFPCRK